MDAWLSSLDATWNTYIPQQTHNCKPIPVSCTLMPWEAASDGLSHWILTTPT